MLRVGLTGNLGSGKSTAASLFASHGAHILASDAIGRELMQPGQPVFDQIACHFGPSVLLPDGTLDRPALARIAFAEARAEELNAIVHPAVIARQADLTADLFTRDPNAVLIVESALIFESKYTAESARFDRIILVTAPESEKIARFLRRQHSNGVPFPAERQSLEAEARRRLALQIPDEAKARRCDHILTNDGPLSHLEAQADALWPILLAAARTDAIYPKSLQ
jgi:dephospho-CoA kinase